MGIEQSTKSGSFAQQNTNGNAHACGFCSFGCYSCEKHGGTVTWLRDAAENGARFLVNSTVEKLLFSSSPKGSTKGPQPTLANLDQFSPTSSRRRCIGALVRFEDGALGIVRAKEAVVVSAGSLNSPAVLLRSGLKNPRIGRNLHLHPVSYITGYYDETINPWDGAIMTAVCLPSFRIVFRAAGADKTCSGPGLDGCRESRRYSPRLQARGQHGVRWRHGRLVPEMAGQQGPQGEAASIQ